MTMFSSSSLTVNGVAYTIATIPMDQLSMKLKHAPAGYKCGDHSAPITTPTAADDGLAVAITEPMVVPMPRCTSILTAAMVVAERGLSYGLGRSSVIFRRLPSTPAMA